MLSRPVLTFSVEGFAAREELLVKTFVRLLVGRTLHNWIYQAQPADLRMVAEGELSNNLVAHSGAQQQALVLGALADRRPNYLCMPLRANELQAELDRIGALVVASKVKAVASALDWHPGQTVRLLRWPPANLVATRQLKRLATLLTGKAQTLDTLHRRSGQPMDDCRRFLDLLEQAGLLSIGQVPAAPGPAAVSPSTPPAAPLAIAPSGLLARIRSRLGLFSGSKP